MKSDYSRNIFKAKSLILLIIYPLFFFLSISYVQTLITEQQPLFTILHFNDAYNIQSNKKGLGGVANFEAYIRQYRNNHSNTMLLFSGDALSPSEYSNILKGRQMMHCLNILNITAGCYGNHQFDLTPKQLEERISQSNFSWLLGNIKYLSNSQEVPYGIQYFIKEVNGLKIGMFGVVGDDFMDILSDKFSQKNLIYQSYLSYSKKISQFLKKDQKCDIVICLAHMILSNDISLAQKSQHIDIILGGHNHITYNATKNQILILKSGTDFRQLGIVKVYPKKQRNSEQNQIIFYGKRFDFSCKIETIPKVEQSKLNTQIVNYIDQIKEYFKKNDKVIGFTNVDLETRQIFLRRTQTNYGNFFSDLMRLYYNADFGLINSGKIRKNAIFLAGQIYYSQISDILNDQVVVKLLPGKVIKQMNGVSTISKVSMNGMPIDNQAFYSVAVTDYMAQGGDGYSFIQNYQSLVDTVEGASMLTILMNFFQQKINFHESNHDPILKREDFQSLDQMKAEFKKHIGIKRTKKLINRTILFHERQLISINPKIQGRIVRVEKPQRENVEL